MYNNQYQNYQNYAGLAGTNNNGNTMQFTQTLTKDEIDNLRRNDKTLSLKVSKTEMDRAICTHKEPNSAAYSVIPAEDGTGDLICTICGARFNPDIIDLKKVEESVKDIINILQSVKLQYVNIPPTTARQYFSLIPFIEKLPMMYKISLENFQRFSPGAQNNQPVYNSNSMLNAYKNVVGGYGPYYNPGMNNMPPYQYQGYDPNMVNPYNPQMNPGYNTGYQNYPSQPVQPMMNQPYIQQAPMNNQYMPYNNGYGNNGGGDNPFYSNGVTPPAPQQMNNAQTQQAPVNNNNNKTQTPAGAAIERVNASATLDA